MSTFQHVLSEDKGIRPQIKNRSDPPRFDGSQFVGIIRVMSSPPPLPAQNPPPKQGMNGCLLAALIIVPIFVILGIVAGAALPALNGARQSGLRAKSASNMRSIALAARTYAADYNDEFPKDHKGNPFTSSQASTLWSPII